jgi:hypothetical protein
MINATWRPCVFAKPVRNSEVSQCDMTLWVEIRSLRLQYELCMPGGLTRIPKLKIKGLFKPAEIQAKTPYFQ